MTAIAGFTGNADKEVTGDYRVLYVSRRFCARRDKPSMTVAIADASGQCRVYVSQALQGAASELKADDIIRARIHTRLWPDGCAGGFLNGWDVLPLDTVRNVARLIPATQCPRRALPALKQLAIVIDGLTVAAVRRCLNALLEQHYPVLLAARGSWNHHHNYSGGLLEHTVAVMDKAQQLASDIYRHDRARVELIMLAAFLHDLGKGLTTNPANPSQLGRHLRHEVLATSMAYETLVQLEVDWPDAVALIASMLDWLCLSPDRRRRVRNDDAEIVHFADVLDVKRYRAAKAQALVTPEMQKWRKQIEAII